MLIFNAQRRFGKQWFLKNIYSASLDWIGKLKLQLLTDYI